MPKYILVLLLISLAACQAAQSSPPEVTPTEDISTPPSTLEASWSEFSINQTRLGLDTPVGWQVRSVASHGVMIVERLGSMGSGNMLEGIQVHLFFPTLADFTVPNPAHANVALTILNQAIARPGYMEDAEYNEPTGFDWGGYAAGYYLVSGANDSRTIVVGVMTPPDSSHLLVCNISAPMNEVERIRPVTLLLLAHLTINDVTLGDALLNTLPDPLVFPAENAS